MTKQVTFIPIVGEPTDTKIIKEYQNGFVDLEYIDPGSGLRHYVMYVKQSDKKELRSYYEKT